MTLQGTKLTGGSYSSDLSFTDSATISSIVGSDYTDDWGTWSSTGGYNGFWFTDDQDISHNGFTYDHKSAVVIDSNGNNVLDSSDRIIGHAYGFGSSSGGSWARFLGTQLGMYSSHSGANSFGFFEVTEQIDYTGDGDAEEIIGSTAADNFYGLGGDDVFSGGYGSDYINGGDGVDKSIFYDAYSAYSTYFDESARLVVFDNSRNEENTIENVEEYEFSGGTTLTHDQILSSTTEMKIGSHSEGSSYSLLSIKDFDGNLHGSSSSTSDVVESYKYQGRIDVNNDGDLEALYTNSESGRWVTASVDSITGRINFSEHGSGGSTRIVGFYIDPLVDAGLVVQGSDHDSQRRFQNDLLIDNLTAKVSGDYDGDGFQEVYWKVNDGSAYLRSLMHADGNIQYANYQSEQQMTDYLTGNGYGSVVNDII